MGRILRRDYLMSDLASAESLYASLPDDAVHILDRLGLASKIEELKAELQQLQDRCGRAAEAVLYFYGEPVVEEHGIDAKFSGDVLRGYQDLVSKQVAAQLGPVGRAGPIKAERETHLHVTNVVHGSFGFELEEIAPDGTLFGSTPLATAVERIASLLGAAKENDEAFADLVAGTSDRVYDALRDFLSIIHKSGATFRLVSPNGEVSFDAAALEAATERTSAERSETADQPVVGNFLGVLLDSRRFEHRSHDTGEIIRGKVTDDIDARQLLPWADRLCVAHLRTVTLSRGSREQRRYTLLKITDLDSAHGQSEE